MAPILATYGSVESSSTGHEGEAGDGDGDEKRWEKAGHRLHSLMGQVEASGKEIGVLLTLILLAAAAAAGVAVLVITKSTGGELSGDPTIAEIIKSRSPTATEKLPATHTLLLLRHAKSSRDGAANMDDFDRPLDASGIEAAERIGQELSDRHVALPELIVSSPSKRTRQTLTIVLGRWMQTKSRQQEENTPMIDFDDDLYALAFGDSGGYLGFVRSHFATGDYRRVMLVGHNPAMEQLVNALVLKVRDNDNNNVNSHLMFPAGAFCEIEFPHYLKDWSKLEEGEGELKLLLNPKNLLRAGR